MIYYNHIADSQGFAYIGIAWNINKILKRYFLPSCVKFLVPFLILKYFTETILLPNFLLGPKCANFWAPDLSTMSVTSVAGTGSEAGEDI